MMGASESRERMNVGPSPPPNPVPLETPTVTATPSVVTAGTLLWAVGLMALLGVILMSGDSVRLLGRGNTQSLPSVKTSIT